MKALWELQSEMTALTGHPFSHESVEEHFIVDEYDKS